MYFKTLFKYRRKAFWLLLAACIIQLVIFYKQGAVATPFFNYGMYAGKIVPMPEYTIYKVYANNQLLQPKQFSIQEWDKVYVPIFMFLAKDTANTSSIEIKNRLLLKLRLNTLLSANENFQNTAFGERQFISWYKNYLSSFSGLQVNDLKIVKHNYSWQGNRLQPRDSTVLFQ